MGLVSYSHDELKAIIAAGGSVLHRGQVISHPDQLPAPEDLAAGNPDEEAAVASALDAQIAVLQARRAGMGAAASSPTPRSGAGTAPSAPDEGAATGTVREIAPPDEAAAQKTKK